MTLDGAQRPRCRDGITGPEPVRVTVVTEADAGDAALAATASSLLGQTLQAWEWKIVTSDGPLRIPIDDARAEVVVAPSRARGLRGAVTSAAEFVVVLDAGARLDPTTLEKWLWFLAGHAECAFVHSAPQNGVDRTPARMIRRSVVERSGSIDAACGPARARLAGFVPPPDDESRGERQRRSPEFLQTANAWIPERFPAENRLEKRGRRLLLIVPFMTVGGADRFNLHLLDQLRLAGWEATVATTIDGSHDWYPLYERRTPDIFPLAHFLRLVDYPRFLHYLIASRQPDVVLISNSELGYRLLPYLRAMCPETPLVDYCHSVAEDWNNGGYPRFSVEYQSLLDLTVTTSEHLRQWMIDRGANSERIEVCYANVDIAALRPEPSLRSDVRGQLEIPGDEPVVLFAGRVSEDKQPRVLAETFSRLDRTGVRFTGVIAGAGPDLPWLRSFIRRRLRSRVLTLGDVRHEEMARLMAASDVLFLPSRSEGIALTLYEAMACGVPVVGALVGGQSELVTPDCGILIERSTPHDEAERYADALRGLLTDRRRRESMGMAARLRVESRFPLEQMGTRMNDVLQRAIELHNTRPRPAPARDLARALATESVELMRLAQLADQGWDERAGATRRFGFGPLVFAVLRRLGSSPYQWGVRRRLPWLPALKNRIQRALTGTSA